MVTTLIYQKTQQADINYYRGYRYFEKGEYNKAIKFYKKSLLINPANQDVLTDLGHCYQWTKKYEEAIDAFQKALLIAPEDNNVKKSLAQTYSWVKEYDKAINLYKEILVTTDDIDIKKQLAEVYVWNTRPSKAKEILETILRDKPQDARAKLLLAKAMHYSGDAEKAAVIYEELLEKEKPEEKDIEKQKEIKGLLGEAYVINKDYGKAIEKYKEILKEDPGSMEARAGLADVFAYSKEFNKAMSLYKEILEQGEDLEIKRKLADVLSWDKKYNEAIELYDEILDEKEDTKTRLQKARVLGWAREYSKSLKEYELVLNTKYNELIELEMRAKRAYWDNRVKSTIRYYEELIEKDPDNIEAMFDLSQAYSYQSMWKEALGEYKRILAVYPGHFRAEEGLQKTRLISKRVLSNTGYKFFEADSPSRDNDIRKHTFFEKLSFPVNNNLKIGTRYDVTIRHFADFNDVIENSGRFGGEYRQNPDWWTEGFYNIFVYDKDIKVMHNFGGSLNYRVFDIGVSSFSYERRRLENNSTVIREGYYADRLKERLDLDVAKRLRIGADYLFSAYSDDNFKNEPGFDILYYFLLEPMKFSLKYRYFFREFDDKVGEYFSPKGFSASQITLNWRHFLNKEEIFFGADDFYYDLKYDITVDSEDIVGHKFSGELNWDINKRLNFNIKGSITNASVDVYKDKNLVVSIKYYF